MHAALSMNVAFAPVQFMRSAVQKAAQVGAAMPVLVDVPMPVDELDFELDEPEELVVPPVPPAPLSPQPIV